MNNTNQNDTDNNRMINKFAKYLFYICIIVIEYLATTTQEIEVIQDSWDKANHFVAFFSLYFLLSFGYLRFSVLKKIILLLIFAIQIEVVQYFIPGRDFSLLDIFADMIGMGIGYIITIICFYKIGIDKNGCC